MGGRQSQEEPSPAPLSCHTTPSHLHTSHHHTPPPAHFPTLSEYTNLHPSSSAPDRSGNRPLEPVTRSSPRTREEQLMELDIALTTLQRRLRAREESRARSHSPHPASLSSGLPLLFLRQIATLQCPLCSKEVLSSEAETHMAQCIKRPRVTYNADTLTHNSGECSICLDDMLQGEEIARLPCLCIYHLKCTQQWFKVSQTCPEHPDLA